MLVAELETWKRTLLADDGIMLIKPEAHDTIWIRPRQGPLQTLQTIVATMKERVPALRAARASAPMERFVTRDGEYGVSLALQTASLHWAIAIVAIDDTYVLFEGIGPDAAIASYVGTLATVLPLGAAPDRVRMFDYRPPPGWYGVRRPLATCWIAPRTTATLLVCDAVPARSTAERMRDVLWPKPRGPTREIERGSLRGHLACGDDELAAQLTDGRFDYRVHAHGTAAIDVLDELLVSIAPLPASDAPQETELAAWTW